MGPHEAMQLECRQSFIRRKQHRVLHMQGISTTSRTISPDSSIVNEGDIKRVSNKGRWIK